MTQSDSGRRSWIDRLRRRPARTDCERFGHNTWGWYSGVGPGFTVRCRRCGEKVVL